MNSLQVTYYISREHIDSFFEAIRPVWEAVVREEKFRFFDIFTMPDPTDPNIEIVRLIEVWEANREWFMDVQVQKEYYQPYLKAIAHMQPKERTFEWMGRREGWCAISKDYQQSAREV